MNITYDSSIISYEKLLDAFRRQKDISISGRDEFIEKYWGDDYYKIY